MKSFSINKPNTQEKTIIVIGTARSGTSIVGSILYHAGVYMGELTNKKQYEDSALIMNGGDIRNFNKVPETRRSILKHKAAIINERNIKYKTWGWKDPNVVWYYKYINNLLKNPCFIFTDRSALNIGLSSYKKDHKVREKDPNYRDASYKSALGHLAKIHRMYTDFNHPKIILDFNELKNGEVTKFVLDWLNIDYDKKYENAIGVGYTKKLF
jgi:hypothetical protein